MSDWSKKFAERVSNLGKKILHPNAENSHEKAEETKPDSKPAEQPVHRVEPAAVTPASPPPSESEMSETQRPREKTSDIGKQQIGKVYAQAMLGAAGSTSAADEMLAELGGIVNDVFRKAPQLEQLLGSPRISADEKIGLLDKVLSGRVSGDLLKVLKVVCRHGRLDCLRAIYHEACTLQNDRKGVIEVEMITAAETDSKIVTMVKEALAAKMGAAIDLRTSTDPNLIGGVKVRVGDRVLDASVQQKLRLLREQAITTASQNIRDHSEKFAN